MTTRKVKWAAALSALFIAQVIASYSLRYAVYFTDDIQNMCNGFFFSDLYTRQFSNHLPLNDVLTAIWGAVFGYTAVSNRLLAGFYDYLIMVLVCTIAARFFRLWLGVIAAFLYLALEPSTWAILNLSELPSVVFVMLAITLCFYRDERTVLGFRRPLLCGFCLGCAFLARAMVLPLALTVLATIFCIWFWRWWRYGVGNAREGLRILARLGVGGSLPLLVCVAYFASRHTLDRLVYWSILWNLETRNGGLNPRAWIGDLSTPLIRQMWAINAVTIGVFVAALVIAVVTKDRRCAIPCLFLGMCAFGGWIGSNPSGIGNLVFHAIPAFPFITMTGVFSTYIIVKAGVRASGFRMYFYRFAGTIAVACACVVYYPIARSAVSALIDPPTSWEWFEIEKAGKYIQQITKPGDTVFVFGTDPYVYLASRRTSATEFSVLAGPAFASKADQVIQELKASNPATVVVKQDFWFVPNLTTLPDVAAYIFYNYEKSDVFPEVYTRRKAPPEEVTLPSVSREYIANVEQIMERDYHMHRRERECAVVFEELPGRATRVSFANEGQWGEAAIVNRVPWQPCGRNVSDVEVNIRMSVSPSASAFAKYPLRVLLLGNGGMALKNYVWAWVPLEKVPAGMTDISASMDHLAGRKGDVSLSQISYILLGGWGPAGGKYEIERVSLHRTRFVTVK
jgi:hypothetical protein